MAGVECHRYVGRVGHGRLEPGGSRMANERTGRRGSTRRRLVGVGLMAACVVGSPGFVVSAGATAQTTVSGSATDVNSCTTRLNPPLQPPGSALLSVTLSSDAFPEPHNGNPITLSNTTLTLTFPADLIQTAVDAGLIRDGFTIPTALSPELAGSNTVEAVHTYSVDTTQTVHVIGGVVQPIVTTVSLPDTTWNPIDAALPVVITEQSMQAVLTIDLPAVGTVTATFDCTPTTAPAIVTLDGATCDKPGNGFGDKNHTHCGPPHPRTAVA